MKTLLKLSLVSLLALSGCVSGTVQDSSICDVQSLNSLPSLPVGVSPPPGFSVPPISFSQTVDVSSSLSKIKDVAKSVSATITQLSLSNSAGNFSWVGNVQIDIVSQNDPTDYPMTTLATYSASSPDQSSTLDLTSQMTANQVYDYLASGPNTLYFTLSGNTLPSQTPELTGTVCISASARVKESL